MNRVHELKRGLWRLAREERGQGIIFAAGTLLLLIGFVALVYNVGRVVERRTQVQLAADNAAYSGAVTEANTVSTIGWTNSAMAQTYYEGANSAVNEVTAGVGALVAYLQQKYGDQANPNIGQYQTDYTALASLFREANKNRVNAELWIKELAQVENSVAVLSQRLTEEEMFGTAVTFVRVGAGGDKLPLRDAADSPENATSR